MAVLNVAGGITLEIVQLLPDTSRRALLLGVAYTQEIVVGTLCSVADTFAEVISLHFGTAPRRALILCRYYASFPWKVASWSVTGLCACAVLEGGYVAALRAQTIAFVPFEIFEKNRF